MRVLVAGDTHGEVGHFKYLFVKAKRTGCRAILQVGDFGYWPRSLDLADFADKINELARAVDIPVYWLDGNHEDHTQLRLDVDVDADEPQEMMSHLWYLPRASVWDWDGIRCMALGGAYSIDRWARVEGVSWFEDEIITRAQVEKACARGKVDWLFTHDGVYGTLPRISEEDGRYPISRAMRLAVRQIVECTWPTLLVHGHYHMRVRTRFEGTRIEALDCNDTYSDSWIVLDTGKADPVELPHPVDPLEEDE